MASRGRQKGVKIATLKDVLDAVRTKKLGELKGEKTIGYQTLRAAHDTLQSFGVSIPKEMMTLLAETQPTSSAKAIPPAIGEIHEKTLATRGRGTAPTLFQIDCSPYGVEAGKSAWVSYEKNQIVITFKKPRA